MKTEILFVIDRSGSMQSIRQTAIDGFNQYIESQRSVAGECRCTFIQFDDVYEIVYQGVPLHAVEQLTDATFKPRGGTALLDAMGWTFDRQGKRIHDERWADLVIMVVLTDGGENASRHFKRERIFEMTRHAESNGWSFVYLGANQDAFATAASLGVTMSSPRNYTQTFDANIIGTQSAYHQLNASTVNLRTTGTVSGKP